jgi:hypothetical protein
MGAGVGSAAGFLFGSYEAFRYRGIPASQASPTQFRAYIRGSFSWLELLLTSVLQPCSVVCF